MMKPKAKSICTKSRMPKAGVTSKKILNDLLVALTRVLLVRLKQIYLRDFTGYIINGSGI